MHTQIINELNEMKLSGMAKALSRQWEQPNTYTDLSFEERFAMLAEQERMEREDRRLTRLLRAAKLRTQADVENIDYQHPRDLERAKMASLTNCTWISHKQNLLLTGPTGCGKTWLACALGSQACRQGRSVRYFRLNRLLEDLRIAHADGRYPRLMAQLAKADLIILDDWGMQKLTAPQRNDLMEVIEDRHGLRSTLVASQLSVKNWHDYIGDGTVADAILDRLIHGAHRLPLNGDSMRRSYCMTEQNKRKKFKEKLDDRDRSN